MSQVSSMRGGTILRSSRSKRFFEYEYRKRAYENLKNLGIDKLIILGGDGSFRALQQFYDEFGISFIGVPSTIDNDIFGTDYCLGVDTALNMIRWATDAIRDTSASFKRGCVIETMGRNCGYLALVSAVTCGAEVCVIPELEYDLNSLCKKLKKQLNEGRKYIVAVIAEGANKTDRLVKWLEEDVGIETRAMILGHIQRGGNPTVYDRLMATEFVIYAIDKLVEQKSNKGLAVVYRDAKFEFVPIEYVNSRKFEIQQDLLDLAAKMTK